MSMLEGDGAREIRVEHNFSLRTWHFRAMEEGSEPIVRTTLDGEAIGIDFFHNLFDRPASHANPQAHNATVTVNAGDDYTVNLQSDGYVDLLVAPAVLDADSIAVFSVSFSQDSAITADFSLAGYDSTPGAEAWFASGGVVLTPGMNRPVHRFILANRDFVSFSVAARPLFPGTVRLRRLNVCQLITDDRVFSTGSTPGLTDTVYSFTGLRFGQPYVAVVAAAAGAVNADVVVEDSIYTSSFQKTVSYYADDQIGVAALIQSKDTTIRLTIPNAMPVAHIYLIPFDAPYRGDA
jgi:hypothetical protein